jgi:hypothetical protein
MRGHRLKSVPRADLASDAGDTHGSGELPEHLQVFYIEYHSFI